MSTSAPPYVTRFPLLAPPEKPDWWRDVVDLFTPSRRQRTSVFAVDARMHVWCSYRPTNQRPSIRPNIVRVHPCPEPRSHRLAEMAHGIRLIIAFGAAALLWGAVLFELGVWR